MSLGTTLALCFFLTSIKENSKLHFRRTLATSTNTLFIKTSAKGKGEVGVGWGGGERGKQCTHTTGRQRSPFTQEESACDLQSRSTRGGMRGKGGIGFAARPRDSVHTSRAD